MRLRRALAPGLVAAALCSAPAHADQSGLAPSPRSDALDAAPPSATTLASEAYQRGAAAFDAGDFARAAIDLARADELAPHPTVLRFALKAVLRAGDPVLAMVLAERADARGLALEEARAARARAEGRVGRVRVSCPVACTASIDGAPAAAGAPAWVLTGDHEVEITIGSHAEQRRVHVDAGATAEIRAEPPPREVAPPPPARVEGGVPRAVFWAGLGLTAALGAGTVASGVDTANRHADYLRAPTAAGRADGLSAELRTNVLLGVTAATAVTTAGIGIFGVRWSRGPASVEVTAQAGRIAVAGRLP